MKISTQTNSLLTVAAKSAATISMEEALAIAAKEIMEAEQANASASNTAGNSNIATAAPTIQSVSAESLETRAKSGGQVDKAALAARAREIMVQNNSVASVAVSQNKEAAKLAAKVTTGDVIIGQITKRLVPMLPTSARLIIGDKTDSPLVQVVVANLISTALTQYKPGDVRAAYVADAVMSSAAVNVAKSFDINGLIDDLLSGISLPDEVTAKA
jgi:hypothetical protein